MNGRRLTQHIGRHFRQADGFDLALLDQRFQRANGVFNRYARVRTVHVIKVNHVRLQARQARLTRCDNAFRAGIQRALPILEAEHAFAGQNELIAAVFEEFANAALTLAKAVKRCRVEEIIAKVECAVEQLV